MTDWAAISERNARSVQTLVGWIFWDPGAIERYSHLGVPGPLGYVPSRGAPLAPAGNDAVIAAFATIQPDAVRVSLDAAREATTFEAMWDARDQAVAEGLHRYVPEHVESIASLAEPLWAAVEACSALGRILFAACLRMKVPEDPLLSCWHAVNCLREWRGDTHMALLVEEDVGPVEASLLHSAWIDYPRDWIAKSRMWTDGDIASALGTMAGRGLATGDPPPSVTRAGIELRQRIEDRTNALTVAPWKRLGLERSIQVADILEPACVTLLGRVDETAGSRYQPASRIHRPAGSGPRI